MSPNLTDQDRGDLAQFFRDAVAADFFPRSKRMRRWKELQAKLDPFQGADSEPGTRPLKPRAAHASATILLDLTATRIKAAGRAETLATTRVTCSVQSPPAS